MAQRKRGNPLPKGPYYFPQGSVGQVDRSLLPTSSIDSFEDVDIFNPQAGDYFRYDGASWVNVPIGTIEADLTKLDSVDYVQFDITYMDGSAEGRLQWNAEDGTLEVGMPGGEVNLQIGQEHMLRCRNTTGVLIPNGSVVYISGATGNKPLIALADADSDATIDVVGFATEDIDHNSNGYVTLAGLVRDVNTLGMTEGDVIYLSSTAGAFTTTRPTPPTHILHLGHVIAVNETTGVILSVVGEITEIDYLSDVIITSIADNELLQWDDAAGVWRNQTLQEAGVYYTEFRRDAFSAMTPRKTLHFIGANGLTIAASDDAGNDETDITLTAPDHVLNDLTNVSDPGGAVAWNTLRHNGTSWERVAAQTYLDHLESLGTMDATTVGGELPSAFADAVHTHILSDITDFPAIYYQSVARNLFTAMTQRATLRLKAGTGITIDAVDDAAGDETEFTFTRADIAMGDLSNVSDPGGAVDYNILRWNSTQWERIAAQTYLDHLESLGIDASTLGGESASAFEDALGNPASDGYHLVSTAAGVRTWEVPPTGAYTLFRRDGFVAMTPRETLHISGSTNIAIAASDDAGNDETDITISLTGTIDADLLQTYAASAFPRKAEAATISGGWTFSDNVLIDGEQLRFDTPSLASDRSIGLEWSYNGRLSPLFKHLISATDGDLIFQRYSAGWSDLLILDRAAGYLTIETNDDAPFRLKQGTNGNPWNRIEFYILDGTRKGWLGMDTAADLQIVNNTANADIILQPSGTGVVKTSGHTWNTGHLVMGSKHLWTDGAGRLRIKDGAPTSQSDGVIVGLQS